MKWSVILHYLAILSVSAGALSLLGAWLAGEGGRLLGLSQGHLYNDAVVFVLLSIAFALGVIIHRQTEK